MKPSRVPAWLRLGGAPNKVDAQTSPLIKVDATAATCRRSPPPVYGGLDSMPILLPHECVVESHEVASATVKQSVGCLKKLTSRRPKWARWIRYLQSGVPGMARAETPGEFSLGCALKNDSTPAGRGRVLITTQRVIFIPSSADMMGFSVFVVKLGPISVMRSARQQWYLVASYRDEDTEDVVSIGLDRKSESIRLCQVVRNVILEHKLAKYLGQAKSEPECESEPESERSEGLGYMQVEAGMQVDGHMQVEAGMQVDRHMQVEAMQGGHVEDKLPSFCESEEALYNCAKQAGLDVANRDDLINSGERRRVLSQLALRM